jgi:hypothetical protein
MGHHHNNANALFEALKKADGEGGLETNELLQIDRLDAQRRFLETKRDNAVLSRVDRRLGERNVFFPR